MLKNIHLYKIPNKSVDIFQIYMYIYIQINKINVKQLSLVIMLLKNIS